MLHYVLPYVQDHAIKNDNESRSELAHLLIRASMNDHLVVSDLLAPAATPLISPRRSTIDQLVADAHVAEARPTLSDSAQAAGIPYIVDPNTPLIQTPVAFEDKWAKLPFASADAVAPTAVDLERLVAETVDFQLDKGATSIVAPYFYASSPTDPWFDVSLRAIEATVRHLTDQNIRLTVLPIFCAQLQTFGNHVAWHTGVDRFVDRVAEFELTTAALCVSPAGAGNDSYGKLHRLFHLARHVKERGVVTYAWRQGIYGPGLVAAGLDGYECGMGTNEQTNVVGQQASRKPRAKKAGGGGGHGIFLEPLGRSVPRKVGLALLGDPAMRPKVLCDDEGCCSTVTATIDHSREHAIRTRARLLAQITDQPAERWRLNHISKEATVASALAGQANSVLASHDIRDRIQTRNLDALARVTAELAEQSGGGQIAS